MLKPILKQIKFAKNLVVYADYITVVFDWAMYICIRQNFFLSFHGKILAPLARFMREPRIITKDRCLIASEYSDVSSLYTRSILFWWFLFDKKRWEIVGSCWWKQWCLLDGFGSYVFTYCSNSTINLSSSQPFDRDSMTQIYWVLQCWEFDILSSECYSTMNYYSNLLATMPSLQCGATGEDTDPSKVECEWIATVKSLWQHTVRAL